MYAALLEAVERGLDARAACLLAVVLQSHEVRRLAHDLLDLIASAGTLQIRREGPLADAPVLHGAALAGAATVGAALSAVAPPLEPQPTAKTPVRAKILAVATAFQIRIWDSSAKGDFR